MAWQRLEWLLLPTLMLKAQLHKACKEQRRYGLLWRSLFGCWGPIVATSANTTPIAIAAVPTTTIAQTAPPTRWRRGEVAQAQSRVEERWRPHEHVAPLRVGCADGSLGDESNFEEAPTAIAVAAPVAATPWLTPRSLLGGW